MSIYTLNLQTDHINADSYQVGIKGKKHTYL